jgi:hypothetical protein
MDNKIETLRSICFTKDDIDTIQNLGDFSDKDIEFMVEFKKIYELGLDQLKSFVDKIDEEGDELDTYSINYYIRVLLNGPLGSYVREFAKDKKYFVNTPDCIGMLGNITKSSLNNTISTHDDYPLGCSVDVYNRLPGFIQTTIQSATKVSEDLFRESFGSSSIVDNTLPLVDKHNQQRYQEEQLGSWVLRPNGNYMVKDSFFLVSVKDVSQNIFDSVKSYLGDDNFRIYKDKKQYTAFDSDKNTSTSEITKIEKEFTVGDESRVITLDLMGDEFDSEEKRGSKLKMSSPEKDEEFLLNTNEGQLGN